MNDEIRNTLKLTGVVLQTFPLADLPPGRSAAAAIPRTLQTGKVCNIADLPRGKICNIADLPPIL